MDKEYEVQFWSITYCLVDPDTGEELVDKNGKVRRFISEHSGDVQDPEFIELENLTEIFDES